MRKRGTNRTTASKNSVLEEKLDDIVFLLQNRSSSSQHGRSTEAVPIPGSSDSSANDRLFEGAEDSGLTDQELLTFRTRYLPHFPLIHLSSDVTAAELQREKPTICLTIRGLATKVASRQMLLGKRLRESITQKILIDGERSLDLLLGLLASIAW